MSGLDESADTLLLFALPQIQEEDRRQARLDHYETLRKDYEEKRDYYQVLMDAADNVIHELQKQTVSND